MKRLGVVFVLASAIAVILAATKQSQAFGLQWIDLKVHIQSVVPPGPVQLELVSAVDVIEYEDENGTMTDIIDAYDGLADLIVGHADVGTLSVPTADGILGFWQDVTDDKKAKIKRELQFQIVLFKKCKLGKCDDDGKICLTMAWDYDDGVNVGSGTNCFSR